MRQPAARSGSIKDETRFVESISGVGPRATPTFAAGRLYTTGANGTINCLDPQTGAAIWTRDLVDDTDAMVPMWGFSSSPLIHNGLAIVCSACRTREESDRLRRSKTATSNGQPGTECFPTAPPTWPACTT